MHTVGWCFHLVKCPSSKVAVGEGCVVRLCAPLSGRALGVSQLRAPVTAGEPRAVCTPQRTNPCARLGLLQSILSSPLSLGALCPECTESCLSTPIVLQLGVVVEHGENRGFCCADTSVFWSINRTFFLGHGSWLITLQNNVLVWGVQAELRKASFLRPAAAFCLCGKFSPNEELLTLSRSLLELLLLFLELIIGSSFPQVPWHKQAFGRTCYCCLHGKQPPACEGFLSKYLTCLSHFQVFSGQT